MKDLTQENQRLESDVLLLQDKLEGKEKENGRLQNEVENLRLVLSETSAQLMKNPSDQKLRELESQPLEQALDLLVISRRLIVVVIKYFACAWLGGHGSSHGSPSLSTRN